MKLFVRLATALLLSTLWLATPTSARAGGGDDDDDVVFDDDDSADDDDSSDDDDSGFVSATVPLEDRVLGGGCEDGQACAVGGGPAPTVWLILVGLAAVRRRR